MRLRFGALPVLILCTLASCSPSGTPPRASSSPTPATGVAVVSGGIAPCRGIPFPTESKYVAGTVTVLRGQLTWANAGPGVSAAIFPTDVAARASVGVNGMYRFVLAPGHYVLVATLAPLANIQHGHIQPSNAQPFVQVTARAGSTVEAGIPNMCI